MTTSSKACKKKKGGKKPVTFLQMLIHINCWMFSQKIQILSGNFWKFLFFLLPWIWKIMIIIHVYLKQKTQQPSLPPIQLISNSLGSLTTVAMLFFSHQILMKNYKKNKLLSLSFEVMNLNYYCLLFSAHARKCHGSSSRNHFKWMVISSIIKANQMIMMTVFTLSLSTVFSLFITKA